jgi:hypothetical protein
MRWLALLVGVTAGLGALVLIAPAPSEHRLLHINCPPGSHGVIRAEGVGRSLMDARSLARSRQGLESHANERR